MLACLFANPSVRQLARAIEPLLDIHDNSTVKTSTLQWKEDQDRPMPCLYVEILGILLLICQWILPIWFAYQFHSVFTLLFVPVFHLLSYVVCQRLLFRPEEIANKLDKLYSWYYYRWWFLNNMWSTNNCYWLRHLLGTPFYNSYLRLCGAKIGYHSYIHTTLIDAPWLLEVGESTFIGEEVVLTSLSYQDQTYELHRIQIGSHCSINTHSVLYENVIIEDYVYIEPMSTITGLILASNHNITINDRLFSLSQSTYQLACLLSLLFIHSVLLLFAYEVYCCCSTLLLPLPICLALSWSVWTLTSLFIVLLLLKFIVGSVTSNHCSLNSYYYLHKIWLRQLIITSFCHSLDFVPPYHVLASQIFRWLGAHIEDDVKFAEFPQILRFPSNLLSIERGVTTFGGANLVPFEMTKAGVCYFDEIHLGLGANLTNWCTIMPGIRLSSRTIVGSLTLITQNTVSTDMNRVLLGIPAREMPFVLPSPISHVTDLSSSSNSSFVHILLSTCLEFFTSKCLFITLYLSLPIVISPFIHVILVCVVYHYSISNMRNRTQSTFSEVILRSQHFFRTWISDFFFFFGSYLSGTQFLVFLYRIFGAQVGSDVILPDINCVTDPHLSTIGDHVRLHRGAHIQVRSSSLILSVCITAAILFLESHI